MVLNCFVSVTMQAQKEAPLDMQCKDKFLVQTVIVSDGTTSKQVLAEMVRLSLLPFTLSFLFFSFLSVWCSYIVNLFLLQFTKESGRVIEDFKLRVVYIPANPPSPVPEGSEEGNSPKASFNDISSQTASLFDDVRLLD